MQFHELLVGLIVKLGLALAVVAIASKLVAGLAVYHPGTRR